MKTACTPSDHGRQIARPFDADYLDRVHGYHETEEYKKAMRKRKVWIEPLFGEAKQWHGMRQFRLRGLQKVNVEGLMIAAGQNLKRLLSATGWGHTSPEEGVHIPVIVVTVLCSGKEPRLPLGYALLLARSIRR
jgi:hypothetical protein